MTILCANPCQTCSPFVGGASSPADPDYPFINLSSEAPDHDDFFGRRYGPPPGGGPPLGLWFSIGCVGFCVSTVSQEDANLCAQRQMMECLSTDWPNLTPNDNPNGGDPFIPTPRELFFNVSQSCDFTCPDGNVFTFIVPTGTFTAFSTAAANAAAYSYACNQAVQQRICMGALTPSVGCAENEYNGTIVVSSVNLPLTFEVVGSLPDGYVTAQNPSTLFINGNTSVPGDYTFTIMVTDSNGNVISKPYSLSVFGFTNETELPDAPLGELYSVILETAGTVTGTITFELGAGELPPGLSLNPDTGEISGTPTEAGDFSFVVTAISDTISCSKNFQIQAGTCGDPDDFFYVGSSGTLATGLSATLDQSEFMTAQMFHDIVISGYGFDMVQDGTPKIAIVDVHWGEAQLFSWLLGYQFDSGDGMVFGAVAGSFNTTIDKTVRIPILPYGNYSFGYTAPDAGANGANMGDCVCVTQLDCPGIDEALALSWGIPNVVQAGSGTASASNTDSTFNMAVSNPGGGLDDAFVEWSGTFTVTGNGVTGRLLLTVTNLDLDAGNSWPNFLIRATSDIDGQVWECNQNSVIPWLTADGFYNIPFVFACTPGSVITIYTELISIQGLGDQQDMTLTGQFTDWP